MYNFICARTSGLQESQTYPKNDSCRLSPIISHAHSICYDLDDHCLLNFSTSTPHALPLQLAIRTRLSCPHLLNFVQLKLIFQCYSRTCFRLRHLHLECEHSRICFTEDLSSPQTSSPRLITLRTCFRCGLITSVMYLHLECEHSRACFAEDLSSPQTSSPRITSL